MKRAALAAIALLAIAAGIFVARQDRDTEVEDLSIVAIPNARIFDETVLVGGQPSPDNLEEAAEAGYRTVINLRPEGEMSDWDEATEAAALGLRYVSIPVAGASGLTRENAMRLRAELDQSDGRPVMVHCASGNRVGALLALSAFHFDDSSPSEALAIGLANGLTSLEPRVAEYLADQEAR